MERDSGGCPSIIEASGLASASGHVARSNDVQLRCPFWTPVRDQEAGLQRDYCICIICDCVPRNFWPTYEDSVRRSLLPPRPTSAATTFLLCLQRTLRESLCTWLVFTGWQLSFLERTISSIPFFFLFSFRPPFVPPSYSTASPSPLFDSSPRLVSSSYRFRFATKGRRSGAAVHLAPRDRATSVDTSTANSTRDGFFDDWNGKQRRTIPSEIGKEMETWIDVTINLSVNRS